MRWRGGRQSENVEDRRGEGGAGGGFPGMGLPIGGRGGLSLGGLAIVVVVCLLLGINPLTLLTGGPEMAVSPDIARQSAGNDEQKQFVSVVLGDTEDVWREIFASRNQTYEEPRLVLFSGGVSTACGTADTAAGPFYCPRDRKVYLDLGFYETLKRRLGAPGDFAQAYVIAHEVGHHVQTLLGTAGQVRMAQQRAPDQANALSVRLELQADCFAGVWANRADKARQVVEAGDIEEALGAASAVGDDTLQRRSQGYVVPDSFTHGSSAERVRWFKAGYAAGAIEACDTFGG